MRFAFGPPVTVTIYTPGPSTADPVTGNPIQGPPSVEVCDDALFADSFQYARETSASTAISDHSMLLPGAVRVDGDSWVEFDGARYEVVGRAAVPRSFSPQIPKKLVNLRYISDLQE